MNHLFETILPIIVCGFMSETTAQTYQVTITNEPFVFLEKAQPAFEGAWDLPEFQLPLGFDFEFFDITTNQLYSIANSFGIDLELNQETGHIYQLLPFYGSLIDRGYQQDSALSPITFQTVGPPGQQIFTIEYKEAGLFEGTEDENGVFHDYISLQVKLYENTGDIVFHIGPYSIQEETQVVFEEKPGPLMGLLADGDYIPDGLFGELILLEGDPLNPTIETDTIAFLNWPIPENTVYRFWRMGTSVGEEFHSPNQSYLFPNPTSGDIHFHENFDNVVMFPIKVVDVNGKQVGLWKDKDEISASDFAPGCYYVFLKIENTIVIEKLIVLPD
jgi:type IX secretion system substrate protein